MQQTYTLVNNQIKPQLEQIDGVAAADVGGGAGPQINVTLHPALLARYGLTATQVDAILQANNIGIPAGNVTHNGVTEPVVTTGKLTTLVQIRNLPIMAQVTGDRRQASVARRFCRLWGQDTARAALSRAARSPAPAQARTTTPPVRLFCRLTPIACRLWGPCPRA
jgi:multidrug efflux pump subunit AcrB